tara:strand:- start:275 stop:898 length:624 start_codon:yes stop_codon:yes gene_type:complete
MGKRWTEKEIEYLKLNFANNYTKQLCNILHKSYTSVAGKAYALGLKKSPEFLKAELEIQADRLRTIGANSRYKSNHLPANKGKQMSADLYAKCAPTMFKKGNKPHNSKHDGAERISVDGYLEVRISKGEYKYKHRVIYEQHYGPIPDGMIVRFKDGNKMNLILDNLELIDRGQNMLNNTIQRFPKELIQTIRLVNKLKTKINAKEQN